MTPILLLDAPAILAQTAASAALKVDIPAQPLPAALAAFASQTGLEIVYVSGIVEDKKSHATSAGLNANETLTRLLRRTGLTFEYLTPDTIRIVAAGQPPKTTTKSGMGGAQEEVIVTGTRVLPPSEVSISPITSVAATQFRQTGLTRAEDVLNRLPMFFADVTSTVNNAADGTATLNLRGLGNQRTLVLLNGTRLGPGSADGRNWSDVNQIPAALIERVDVLTGGASAVYGADAVAGVVNFIITDSFEGVRLDVGYHINQHQNNDQDGVASLVNAVGDALPPSNVNTAAGQNASLIAGTNFANNKANVTGFVTYDHQAGALQSQFDYSACPVQVEFAPVLTCGGSDTSRGGRFSFLDNNGNLVDYTVDLKTGGFRPYAARDAYNFAPLSYYQTPNVRWTGGAFVNYEFSPHADAYTRVTYMRNSLTAQLAPSGSFGNYSFIPCADPLLTAQEAATLCTAANIAANGSGYEIYDGKNYPGLDLTIFRRSVEGGNRIYTHINETLRAVLGVKGGLADGWTYNVYAQRSTVHIDDTTANELGNPQIGEALNVLPGPRGPVCGVQSGIAFTPDSKCIPWDIWVPGAVTPAALASLSVPVFTTGRVTEQIVSGSATGDLGPYGAQLPAADEGLQLNLGIEWRNEQSSFAPNYEQQQGYVGGQPNAISPIAGQLTVEELFMEMRLPLAAHQMFADDLFVDGGYRYSRYSSGFTTNTYKFGLQWAPVGGLRLRGSYQRAVRVPNINELYSLQFVNINDGTIDSCAGTPSISLATCELTGVKPAQYGHIPPSPFGVYNGLTGGNPSLQPEVADTYTVGLVLQPRETESLKLSIDYFNIKVEGVIGAAGSDTVLLGCLASAGNPVAEERFCPLIHRDAQGSLWLTTSGYVSDLLVNEGELATRGIDVNGSYRVPLATAGSLLLELVGTHLQSLQTTPVTGMGSYDCAGYFGKVCGVVTPKWRHVLNATWSTPWYAAALGLRWRYIGSSESAQTSPSPYLSGTPYLPLAHIPAYTYFDLVGTIDLSKTITLQLGVNNIADKAPPLVIGADCTSTLCNGNTFPGVYDTMGRYLFVNLSAQW